MFSTIEIRIDRHPELWRCRDCGSRYVNNVLPAADAIRLYSKSNSTARWSTQPFEAIKTPEVTAALAVLANPGVDVLDVGCNGGELLDFMQHRGCRTYGADLSLATRAVLEAKSHRWFPDLDAAPLQSFDVLTAFDLIEHVYDLPGFLGECHKRLRVGGRLILLTGDCGCASARLTGSRWWYSGYPEHIVFPSRRYLASIPGFRLVGWTRTYASLGYRFSMKIRVKAVVKWIIGRGYNGLPAMGPDHVLASLEAV